MFVDHRAGEITCARGHRRVTSAARRGDVRAGENARLPWDHKGVCAHLRGYRFAAIAETARFVAGVSTLVLMIALGVLLSGAGAGASAGEIAAAGGETVVDPSAGNDAAGVVMKQIEALRDRDFAAAYALASRELRRHFSRGEFEWMVKKAHPELASSAYAFVVRTHEAGGFLYVTVKVHGRNGKDVEALYEIVREGDALKVNAVTSRRDDGVL
jgi:hypothetical protein